MISSPRYAADGSGSVAFRILPWLALLALALVLPATGSGAEDIRYVTDKLRLSVYPHGNGEGERLGVLGSGTPVTVLKRNGAYVKVRTRDGLEGWVKAAYLQKEPTAALRLARLEKENEALREEIEGLKSRLREVSEKSVDPEHKTEGESPAEAPAGPDPRVAALEEELRSLRTVHQALLEEYESLKARVGSREDAGAPSNGGISPSGGSLADRVFAMPWIATVLALLTGLLAGVVVGRRASEGRLRRRLYGFRLE